MIATYLLQHILDLAMLKRKPRVQKRSKVVSIVVRGVGLEISAVVISTTKPHERKE